MAVNTKRIKVPIEAGIRSFGTGYEIGPQLRNTVRYINKYIPQDSVRAVNFVNQTWEPMEAEHASITPLDDGVSVSSAERFENGETSAGNTGYLFGGTALGSVYGFWDDTGALRFSSGTLGGQSSIVHWRGLATPTTFITGINIAAMKKTTDRVIFTTYAPVGFPGVAEHLLAYQNRLWLTKKNQLFYTDVFDPNNVRLFGFTNPYVVPMPITALERIGVSDVDPAAQSHLFIPGMSQIWILDGAPGAGNEVLRRYTSQVGCEKQRHVTSTNLGLVFFGSDRMLYLVPPGAAGDPTPIGYGIRNLLESGEVMIAWRNPYLMVFVGNIDRTLYIDFSGSAPKYWGLRNGASFIQIAGGVGTRFPTHDYFYITGEDLVDGGCWAIKVRDPVAGLGSLYRQEMQTGYIFEPGHDVAFRRAHLAVRQGIVPKTFTYTSTDDQNGTVSRDFTVAAGDKLEKVMVVLNGPDGTRGDFLYNELKCQSAEDVIDRAMAAVETWEIEYDVVGRMQK